MVSIRLFLPLPLPSPLPCLPLLMGSWCFRPLPSFDSFEPAFFGHVTNTSAHEALLSFGSAQFRQVAFALSRQGIDSHVVCASSAVRRSCRACLVLCTAFAGKSRCCHRPDSASGAELAQMMVLCQERELSSLTR